MYLETEQYSLTSALLEVVKVVYAVTKCMHTKQKKIIKDNTNIYPYEYSY